MRRLWGFVGLALLLMAVFLIVDIMNRRYGSGAEGGGTPGMLRAGFARVNITPPAGTPMTGFGERDWDPSGSRGVHDDLFVRALYLSQGERRVLIMGFDLLFFNRAEADRLKGAIGRYLDLAPKDILLNTSHTHTGPKVGDWYYTPAAPMYFELVEKAVVEAARKAHDSARTATLWAGSGTTALPMSRRLVNGQGIAEFRPSPEGTVCNALPVVMVKDTTGTAVCLLFSVSCHPSTVKGVDRSYLLSADYPGAAMARLDSTLGAPVSLFLQGAGGDAKASVIGEGETEWRAGTWEDVDRAGALVAGEVLEVIQRGLAPVEADLAVAQVMMEWPFTTLPDRKTLEEILKNPQTHSESSPEVMKLWAGEQLDRLNRGLALPASAEITLHGVRLGKGLRLVGLEGEAVAELGNIITTFYPEGVTFPLGYTDGARMYLPVTSMLAESGYEVESYWEYHQPAPLAGGMERVLAASLGELRASGIE